MYFYLPLFRPLKKTINFKLLIWILWNILQHFYMFTNDQSSTNFLPTILYYFKASAVLHIKNVKLYHVSVNAKQLANAYYWLYMTDNMYRCSYIRITLFPNTYIKYIINVLQNINCFYNKPSFKTISLTHFC